MLSYLEIKNYALISHLKIEFEPHLTIITGETGSGKSIMLGALSLIRGKRADAKTVREGTDKCIVEAHFEHIDKFGIKELCEAYDIDYSEPLILRREITAAGKSRAFVNDTPVVLQQMAAIADKLLYIHSQHETLQITENRYQIHILDTLSQSQDLLLQYQNARKAYLQKQDELEQLINDSIQAQQEKDYITFQYNTLHDANLQADEQEALEQQLSMMQHSEELKLSFSSINNTVDGEQGITSQLRQATSMLRRITSYWEQGNSYADRLEAARIELDDIAADLSSYAESLDYDPSEKERVEERLALIYNLQQKYHVSTIAELQELHDKYQSQIEQIDNFDLSISKLKKDVEELKKQLEKSALELSKARKKAAPAIAKEIANRLQPLGIPHAQFDITLEPLKDIVQWTEAGADNVQFLFSANQHHATSAVAQTASGGELSRLMLVLNAMLAEQVQLPTLIFDEIDTGVSGETAMAIGRTMSTMAQQIQLMVITHLPQVAAQKGAHLKVSKQVNETDTVTTIQALDSEQRIMELAQMLSGAIPTEAALNNARELLQMN
ncbi:MAG: DNA repair protein RecN [Paludibacteraceae bacterium]|nr:DNA repair protein RecN [Paludibacteraceae bacterium]